MQRISTTMGYDIMLFHASEVFNGKNNVHCALINLLALSSVVNVLGVDLRWCLAFYEIP